MVMDIISLGIIKSDVLVMYIKWICFIFNKSTMKVLKTILKLGIRIA